MAQKKASLEAIQKDIQAGFDRIGKEISDLRSELRDDLRHVRKDILAIHSDLIKHDERMDAVVDHLQSRTSK